MARWTKKVTKAMKGQLLPDEEVHAAVFLQPAGTIGEAVGMSVGGMLGKAVASRLGSGDDARDVGGDAGLAGTLADEATVLAVTNERLLVMGFSSFGGKPKGLKSAMSPSDLVRVELEKQQASHLFVAHFADGTGKVFEAPRPNNDTEAFATFVNTG